MTLAPVQWLGIKPQHLDTESLAPPDDKTSLPGTQPPPKTDQPTVPEEKPNPFSLLPESAVQTILLGTTNAILGIVRQSVVVLIFLFFLLMSSRKRDRPIGGAW